MLSYVGAALFIIGVMVSFSALLVISPLFALVLGGAALALLGVALLPPRR